MESYWIIQNLNGGKGGFTNKEIIVLYSWICVPLDILSIVGIVLFILNLKSIFETFIVGFVTLILGGCIVISAIVLTTILIQTIIEEVQERKNRKINIDTSAR